MVIADRPRSSQYSPCKLIHLIGKGLLHSTLAILITASRKTASPSTEQQQQDAEPSATAAQGRRFQAHRKVRFKQSN
jgi:hypothetical protein